jgi:tRNA-2-methylthio-N6-dimethylallyladenosine synthase
MKYFILTLGCQVNISDSLRISDTLNNLGFISAPKADGADLIIINACSVRQSAVDRIYGNLKHYKNPSKAEASKKVIITGCVLPADKKKLIDKVDLIIDIKDLDKLPKFLSEIYNKKFIQKSLKKPTTNEQLPTTSLIPIMTGCNNFCSYCAVPFTRGRENSYPASDIICQFEKLVQNGTKKIMLLGQNVNTYKPSFTNLLKKIIKIPGDFEILFMSANPWNFPDELIEIIAKSSKMSKFIHLPVQSGDNEILKKMNRNYTATDYLKIIRKLRKAVPDLNLSTDIIVGYPGETKKAFSNTFKLCKKAKFDKAYVSQYSPRPGTISARQQDNVSKVEKKRRWKILDDLINQK